MDIEQERERWADHFSILLNTLTASVDLNFFNLKTLSSCITICIFKIIKIQRLTKIHILTQKPKDPAI